MRIHNLFAEAMLMCLLLILTVDRVGLQKTTRHRPYFVADLPKFEGAAPRVKSGKTAHYWGNGTVGR
jgi:hypothetical protein